MAPLIALLGELPEKYKATGLFEDAKLLHDMAHVDTLAESNVNELAVAMKDLWGGKLDCRFSKGLKLFATGREIVLAVVREATFISNFGVGRTALASFMEAAKWQRPPVSTVENNVILSKPTTPSCSSSRSLASVRS